MLLTLWNHKTATDTVRYSKSLDDTAAQYSVFDMDDCVKGSWKAFTEALPSTTSTTQPGLCRLLSRWSFGAKKILY